MKTTNNIFFHALRETLKGFLSKRTVLKVSLLYVGPTKIIFAGVYVCTFLSPEILQAGAVKGLNSRLRADAATEVHSPRQASIEWQRCMQTG